VKAFRPLWVAFRAAVIAAAVFWAALTLVDKLGWQAPLGLTEPLVFFVIFFLGVLMVGG
jgi:hypothetical protein